jgi:hypothetical protein
MLPFGSAEGSDGEAAKMEKRPDNEEQKARVLPPSL